MNKNNKLNFVHDIEKAKSYLDKAGYKNGTNLPEITLDLRSSGSQALQQAEFVKNELNKIGVNIKIQTNTFSAFLRKAKEGKLDFWIDGWHLDYPDSENSLQLLSNRNHPPGINSTYYNNQKFENLLDQIKVTPNNEKKVKLMNEIEQIVQDDQVWTMLFYSRKFGLYNKRIKNFYPSPFVTNNIKYLEL